MKKIVIITILILSLFIIKIPEYVELNNLAIIESVGISYKDDIYQVHVKEVIPYKDDQGISYRYKYYSSNSETLEKAFINIGKKCNKKVYLNKTKLLIINKKYKKIITKELLKNNLKTKHYIYTNEDIEKVIREKS